MSEHMIWYKETMMFLSSDCFNRGPYSAGGDHTTLNATAYKIGSDFDPILVPVSRLIVDFSKDVSLVAINSSGQSDNPSSLHYTDQTEDWLKGDYHEFPFSESKIKKHYTEKTISYPVE